MSQTDHTTESSSGSESGLEEEKEHDIKFSELDEKLISSYTPICSKNEEKYFDWEMISEEKAKEAIDAFLAINNFDLSLSHSKVAANNFDLPFSHSKVVANNFPPFLTFFNGSFARQNDLPINSITLDMFTKIIKTLYNVAE